MTDKCNHIFKNLTLCNRRNGYQSTVFCKKHIKDVNGDSKEAKIQSKRLHQIHETNRQLSERGLRII